MAITGGPWIVTSGSASPYYGVAAQQEDGTLKIVGVRMTDIDAQAIAAVPEMVDAIRTTIRALESDEFKAWEGMAATMAIRMGGLDAKGYQGEQFIHKLKAALAKAEGRES